MRDIISRVDWAKIDLLPVVVQDSTTDEVLMMAYMDKEGSLAR